MPMEVDFRNALDIFTGEQIQNRGNTSIQFEQLFPGADVIEYHFSGFNAEYAGMDWKSLYLVFDTTPEKTSLRAIVHGQRTI
jgi:hypothetical protein